MPEVWIFLVVIFSSLIKGITGFGFALFSFPLLLIWYSPKEIIPVLMICNLIASILIVIQKKEHKLMDKNAYFLIGTGGVFTIAGVIALSASTGHLLVKLSGLFFIGLTIYSLFSGKKNTPIPSRHYLFAGAVIGFLTGAVSVSGPPLALFLNRAKVSNQKFREVFAAFSVITAIIAIAGYYQAGMITIETLKNVLLFTPILLTGTIVGKKLNTKMSVSSFQNTNIILTLIASLLLILNP